MPLKQFVNVDKFIHHKHGMLPSFVHCIVGSIAQSPKFRGWSHSSKYKFREFHIQYASNQRSLAEPNRTRALLQPRNCGCVKIKPLGQLSLRQAHDDARFPDALAEPGLNGLNWVFLVFLHETHVNA